MKYIYNGFEIANKKVVKGIIEAESDKDATLALRSRGIQATSLRKDWKSIEIRFKREKIKIYDLAVASRQLSAMIGAGLPLARSLEILSTQAGNKKLGRVFKDIKEQIDQGSSFNEALLKYKQYFSDLYISMVKSGEASGSLDDILNRLAIYQEKAVALRRKVKSAVTYPITVMIFAAAILAVIMIFVVPRLASIFEDLGSKLPAMTMITINTSKFIASWKGGGSILLSILFIILLLRYLYKKTVKGRYAIDAFLLKLPKFGDLIKKVSIARFTRSMGTLLKSGVPILTSIDITASNSGNKVIEKNIVTTRSSVESGRSLAEPLRNLKIFPPMVVEMVRVGEETGNLDDMLFKVADYYEDEVDRSVEAVTSMILPVFIFFLGGAIGFIVISLYLPIFQLGDLIK